MLTKIFYTARQFGLTPTDIEILTWLAANPKLSNLKLSYISAIPRETVRRHRGDLVKLGYISEEVNAHGYDVMSITDKGLALLGVKKHQPDNHLVTLIRR